VLRTKAARVAAIIRDGVDPQRAGADPQEGNL
jgi:5-(carboxyamino)imidazole ribonucleotide synthase